MEHLETELLNTGIQRLTDAAHLELEASQVHDLGLHLARVLEANRSFNLTAIRNPHEAVRLHVFDSLTALPEVEAAPPGTLVDIGSGAGFPGIPLAIATGRPVVLIESVGKKARFLAEVGSALSESHSISAVRARAEDVGLQRPGEFAVVLARAVSPLASIVELAAPLLQERGVFLAMKGQVALEELAAGDRVAEIVGLRRVSKRDFNLPEGGESRCIIAYLRIGVPNISLPREVGQAQHKPLA